MKTSSTMAGFGTCIVVVVIAVAIEWRGNHSSGLDSLESVHEFNIPAGPLRQTATTWMNQSGLVVDWPDHHIDDARLTQTRAIHGRMRSIDALASMLYGSHWEVGIPWSKNQIVVILQHSEEQHLRALTNVDGHLEDVRAFDVPAGNYQPNLEGLAQEGGINRMLNSARYPNSLIPRFAGGL